MLLICIFIFTGCEPSVPKCAMEMSEFLRKEGKNVIETARTESIIAFKDNDRDSYGGYYTFYKNGNIKEYNFLINPDTSIYTEMYDPEGYLMSVQGNPLIHKYAEITDDSLIAKLYFLTYKKQYLRISVLADNHEVLPLTLSEDTLFSNVGSVRYNIAELAKEGEIYAYLDVEYKNECTGEIRTFRDSINVHYKTK